MEKSLVQLLGELPGGYPPSFVEWVVTGRRPEPPVRFDFVPVDPDFPVF
ncbi:MULTISPECIES: hypothetical protein [Mycobacterium]|nr:MULTISPECIES: hypothetical protein [Mycobacterium]MDP7706919.1 hypothetical protein [Mycobacterium sp. TY815]